MVGLVGGTLTDASGDSSLWQPASAQSITMQPRIMLIK